MYLRGGNEGLQVERHFENHDGALPVAVPTDGAAVRRASHASDKVFSEFLL